MNEIEVKVLNIDKDEIERKLINLGAKLVKDEDQVNMRFDTIDNYLKKNCNGYLRIRKTKNYINGKSTNTLTLKKNISRNNCRINEEIETEISNVEEMIKILNELNYIMKAPADKHRRSYIYDDILFEIDEWDKKVYAKPYLEIEVKHEEKLEQAIKLLDIDRRNITVKPIEELIKGK